MRYLYLMLFCCFLNQSVSAQWISIRDAKSDKPISTVTIANKNRTIQATTGIDGRVSLDNFGMTTLLYIQAPLHITKQLTKQQLIENHQTLYLDPDDNQLSEVVISVLKWTQEKEKIPQKTVSISSNEILLQTPQTTADLLQKSGQVFIQKSQLGGGSPIIRGFSTNRLLITVDGVRMNTAIFRGGNVQNVISIDPFTIGQTEIILGPGSVAYGSDAVGGVMNFYTLRPQLKTKNNKSYSANTILRYASANQEKTGHLDINFGFDKWAFLTSVSYSDFDDLKMGQHGPDAYLRREFVIQENGTDLIVPNVNQKKQVETGYDQINFMQKAYFQLNDEWSFDASLLYSTTSNFSRYDRLIRYRNEQLRSAEWFYGPQRWLMGTIQSTHSPKNTIIYDNMKVTAAYQFFEESRNNRDFGSNLLNRTKENVDAYSINVDLEKHIGKKNSFFYGTEYVLNHVTSEGSQLNRTTNNIVASSPRYPDGSSWQSIAAYLGHQHYVNDKFNIQSGVRYNHILLDADFNTAFFDFPFDKAEIDTGALTANTGFSWNPSAMFQTRLNLSTAFRAPNIDDIGKIFDSEPGAIVVPNPKLQPEYAYSGEVGVQIKPVSFATLDLTSYYTLLDNALVRRDFKLNGSDSIFYSNELSRVQAIQNASKARIYGFEAGLELQLAKSITLTSQYAITRGYDEEQNGAQQPSRHVAPHFGNTHLLFQQKKLTIDVFVDYNGSLNFEQLSPSEKSKAYLYATDRNGNPYSPSWYTFNFRTRYQINKSLQSIIALENITDQRYRTYSSGIVAPGRNLVLTLKYAL